MLWSCGKQFLFCHVQRTGGTSLTLLLRRNIPDILPIANQHAPLAQARNSLGTQAFEDVYRFAFVRNPWDRLVSLYMSVQRTARFVRHPELMRGPPGDRPRRRQVLAARRELSFPEFILLYRRPQLWWLCDDRGRMLASKVFRFEQYAESVQEICGRFGLTANYSAHRNATKHDHYTTYYTAETRRLVADLFAADIVEFGYRFGE